MESISIPDKRKRILLVNKFFYARGGDCIHTLNLMRLLQSQGHEVAVFAMQFPENIESEWTAYFPEEVTFSGGGRLSAIARIFGGAGVKERFTRLLKEFRPDVVHLHNVHSYLSPVMAGLAHKQGIRVVWTLHDYKLLCPSYSCLREGKPCELCFADKTQVWRTRCMKGSLVASVLGYVEALYWNREKMEHWVDRFICPSSFLAQKMEQGGFSRAKLRVLCNFIDTNYLSDTEEAVAQEADESYCYIGRLSAEKGVQTLLQAASGLPYKLYIAGDGPLREELESEFASTHIVFLGRIDAFAVKRLLSKVAFSVIPSEWYENNPLSVIESLCMGTPVLGARIGGIPELINEGETGAIFEAGNEKELKEKIIYLFNHRLKNKECIRKDSLERFSASQYYSELIKIYDGE